MHIVGIPENSLMISAVAIALLSEPWLSSEQTGTDRNAGPTRVTGHKKIPRLGESVHEIIDDSARLLRPLQRKNRKGEWQPRNWDPLMDDLVKRPVRLVWRRRELWKPTRRKIWPSMRSVFSCGGGMWSVNRPRDPI